MYGTVPAVFLLYPYVNSYPGTVLLIIMQKEIQNGKNKFNSTSKACG